LPLAKKCQSIDYAPAAKNVLLIQLIPDGKNVIKIDYAPGGKKCFIDTFGPWRQNIILIYPFEKVTRFIFDFKIS
jgi:hypothetical protein